MTAPTTYHLRNESGIEVFTGTISPAPGGGSHPVKIERVQVTFSTPDIVLVGAPIYVPTPGEVLLWALTYWNIPTAAWNGSTPSGYIGFAGAANAVMQGSLAFADSQQGSSDAFNPAIVAPYAGATILGSDPVLATVDDGSGGDPGSSQGAGEIVLYLLAAP